VADFVGLNQVRAGSWAVIAAHGDDPADASRCHMCGPLSPPHGAGGAALRYSAAAHAPAASGRTALEQHAPGSRAGRGSLPQVCLGR